MKPDTWHFKRHKKKKSYKFFLLSLGIALTTLSFHFFPILIHETYPNYFHFVPLSIFAILIFIRSLRWRVLFFTLTTTAFTVQITIEINKHFERISSSILEAEDISQNVDKREFTNSDVFLKAFYSDRDVNHIVSETLKTLESGSLNNYAEVVIKSIDSLTRKKELRMFKIYYALLSADNFQNLNLSGEYSVLTALILKKYKTATTLAEALSYSLDNDSSINKYLTYSKLAIWGQSKYRDSSYFDQSRFQTYTYRYGIYYDANRLYRIRRYANRLAEHNNKAQVTDLINYLNQNSFSSNWYSHIAGEKLIIYKKLFVWMKKWVSPKENLSNVICKGYRLYARQCEKIKEDSSSVPVNTLFPYTMYLVGAKQNPITLIPQYIPGKSYSIGVDDDIGIITFNKSSEVEINIAYWLSHYNLHQCEATLIMACEHILERKSIPRRWKLLILYDVYGKIKAKRLSKNSKLDSCIKTLNNTDSLNYTDALQSLRGIKRTNYVNWRNSMGKFSNYENYKALLNIYEQDLDRKSNTLILEGLSLFVKEYKLKQDYLNKAIDWENTTFQNSWYEQKITILRLTFKKYKNALDQFSDTPKIDVLLEAEKHLNQTQELYIEILQEEADSRMKELQRLYYEYSFLGEKYKLQTLLKKGQYQIIESFVLKQLVLNYEYYQLKYSNLEGSLFSKRNNKIITKDIISVVDQNSIIIEYDSPSADRMSIATISRHGFGYNEYYLSSRDSIKLLMSKLADTSIKYTQFVKASNTLYNTLIVPIEDTLKHYASITFLPRDVYENCSFHLLFPRRDTIQTKGIITFHNDSYASLPYLFKYFNIKYDFRFDDFQNLKHSKDKCELIGVNISSLLINSSSEVEYLKEFGGITYNIGNSKKVNPLLLNKCNILHLSGHKQDVLKCGIFPSILIETKPSDYLYPIDTSLGNLSLVYLSSCSTNDGFLTYGSGMQTIAKYLSRSAVKSLIVSNWKVDDLTASELSSRFYRYLSKGSSTAEALRLAKKDYLESYEIQKEKKHPFYWGGLVHFGADQKFNLTHTPKAHWIKKWGVWLMSLATILTISGIYWTWRRELKKSIFN